MTQFVEIAEAGQKTTQEMQQIIDKFNQELLGSNSDIETALKQYQPEALILLKSEMVWAWALPLHLISFRRIKARLRCKV